MRSTIVARASHVRNTISQHEKKKEKNNSSTVASERGTFKMEQYSNS